MGPGRDVEGFFNRLTYYEQFVNKGKKEAGGCM
jgi:hypothetical protein